VVVWGFRMSGGSEWDGASPRQLGVGGMSNVAGIFLIRRHNIAEKPARPLLPAAELQSCRAAELKEMQPPQSPTAHQRTGCGVQQLAPRAAVVLCVVHAHRRQALAGGGVGLVAGQDALHACGLGFRGLVWGFGCAGQQSPCCSVCCGPVCSSKGPDLELLDGCNDLAGSRRVQRARTLPRVAMYLAVARSSSRYGLLFCGWWGVGWGWVVGCGVGLKGVRCCNWCPLLDWLTSRHRRCTASRAKLLSP